LHLVLGLQVVWATASAAFVGTALHSLEFFGIVDDFVVPAALFTIAPVAYRERIDRALLLRAVALMSIYLGLMSAFQSFGITGLLVPSYLSETASPGSIARATGPSLQVASNGATLAMCLPFAFTLMSEERRFWRGVGFLAVLLSATGAFLTLTRSVWGAIIAVVAVYVVLDPRVRRRAVVLSGALVAGVAAALVLSPALAAAVLDRLSTVRSINDRTTTNAAAISMFEEHPLTGVGYRQFLPQVRDYVRQLDLVPLTETDIPVHNVLLGRAAELGSVGVGLSILALLLGPVLLAATWLRRRERTWSRIALSAFAGWFCVAMATPMGYAFPNYVLWLLVGIAFAIERQSREGVLMDGWQDRGAVPVEPGKS
jgi:O-antigen ligase